ncbi:MAG: ABC transporter ATP-binding protein [Planctomycetes bacterium]|nr:ABC transporter ATP-binding protein [Planctomycetota bacterium]
MNVQPLPDTVRSRLVQEGVRPENVCLWAESDLDLSGVPAWVWVVVTRDRVLAIPANGEQATDNSFEIQKVSRFKIRSTIGSAFLQALVEGLPVDVARFSNARRERFSRLLEQLERLRQGESVSVDRVYENSELLCEKCGLPLPAPKAPCPRCIKQGAVFVRTLKMLRRYLVWVVILFALMLLGIALDMMPPFLTKILVDDVLKVGAQPVADVQGALADRKQELLLVVLCLVGATLARNVLNMIIGRMSSTVGTSITFDIRCKLFDRVQQFSIDYYDRHPVGNLLQRVHGDAEAFHSFVNQVAGGYLLNVLRVIAIGIVLFSMNWRLASFILLPIPLVILGTAIYWKRIYPRYYKLSDSSSKVYSTLNAIFSGIRLVKAFSQEKKERDRFVKNIDYYRGTHMWVQKSVSTFSPIMAFIFSLGGLIVWYAGGQLVLENRGVTLGTLMAFLAYLSMFYGPLQSLTDMSNWLSGFLAASQRVFDILDTPPAMEDQPDAKPLDRVTGSIELDRVTFGYDPYNPVIKDVSMRIDPGQMIGIVGKSGSGKSTLINLICRFYDIQKGSVRIDGRDVRELRRQDLRRHIGLVLQEPFLFRASIAENIAYGRPDATPQEILDAAKAAYAHDFIMRQPLGYDTQLGERGAGLSGGERQRVSIARALLCNPAILILDEATSSVDTESEQEIQRALAVLCRGRTTIAIAHRLSTLKGADRIYVIDDGRVAEFGSHGELMDQKGIYYKLVKIQTELARLEDKV